MDNTQPFTEAELTLAETYGIDRGFLEMMIRCPECNELLLATDNDVWLNAKPEPPGVENHTNPLVMGIIKMGGMRMAAGGDVQGGSKHMIHDHQPPEE